MSTRIIIYAAAAMLALACTRQAPKAISTSMINCEDSSKFVSFTMKLELPSGDDMVSKTMRQELLDIAAGQLTSMESEIEAPKAPAGLDESGIRELFRSTFSAIETSAKRDYDERASYILCEDTMTDEEKEMAIDSWPGWECIVNIEKLSDTDSYTVFSSSNYVYMGGAHGGVTGAGYLTFEKEDGTLFSDFLKDGCFEEIKPLIRKGLCEYLSESGEAVTERNLDEFLFDEDGPTALPSYVPYPTEDGLLFVYQQYEIAPYAMGMPAFKVPYKELRPYLTDEAISLIGL